MPTTYTSLLRYALPATGEDAGTWGTIVNNNITSMVEQSVAGMSAPAMGDSDYTLTALNGVSDDSRAAIVRVTSSVTLTANRNVIIPGVSKKYVLINATTGGKSLIITTGSGTTFTVPAGQSSSIYCDGINVYQSGSFWQGQSIVVGPAPSGITLTVQGTQGINSFAVTGNFNGLLQSAILNSATGGNAQSIFQLGTGTANSIANLAVVDNNAAPYMQWYGGAGVQYSYFGIGSHTAFYHNAAGNVVVQSPTSGVALTIAPSGVGTAINAFGNVTLSGSGQFVGNTAGVINGGNAPTGSVGEALIITPSTGNLTNNIAANAGTLTLTAGNWDVYGNVYMGGTGIGSLLSNTLSISSTSSTIDAACVFTNQSGTAPCGNSVAAPCKLINTSSSITVYLVVAAAFSSGNVYVQTGSFFARRRY